MHGIGNIPIVINEGRSNCFICLLGFCAPCLQRYLLGNVVGREFLNFSSMTGHVRTSFLVGFVKDFLDITHFHHILLRKGTSQIYSFCMAAISVDWTWSSNSSIWPWSSSVETFSSSTTRLIWSFLIPKARGTHLEAPQTRPSFSMERT